MAILLISPDDLSAGHKRGRLRQRGIGSENPW
jgi:hypothetical protein